MPIERTSILLFLGVRDSPQRYTEVIGPLIQPSAFNLCRSNVKQIYPTPLTVVHLQEANDFHCMSDEELSLGVWNRIALRLALAVLPASTPSPQREGPCRLAPPTH